MFILVPSLSSHSFHFKVMRPSFSKWSSIMICLLKTIAFPKIVASSLGLLDSWPANKIPQVIKPICGNITTLKCYDSIFPISIITRFVFPIVIIVLIVGTNNKNCVCLRCLTPIDLTILISLKLFPNSLLYFCLKNIVRK